MATCVVESLAKTLSCARGQTGTRRRSLDPTPGPWISRAAQCEASCTSGLGATTLLRCSDPGFNGACASFCLCRQNESLSVFTEPRKRGQASKSTFAGHLQSGWPVHVASEGAVLRLHGRRAKSVV